MTATHNTSHLNRMVTDMLLCNHNLVADHNGHALYAEVHSETDRRWLHRLGYEDCGPSLGHPPEPQSYVLARAPRCRLPSRQDHPGGPVS